MSGFRQLDAATVNTLRCLRWSFFSFCGSVGGLTIGIGKGEHWITMVRIATGISVDKIV